MKKLLLAAGILLGILIVGIVVLLRSSPPSQPAVAPPVEATAAPAPVKPDTVVFDLTYRPLTGPNDPLSYRSYWAFGGRHGLADPFVKEVCEQVKEYELVYNAALPQAQWSVVAVEDGKPVALYFDADANAKLSDDERFAPVPSSARGLEYAFVTSDFTIDRDGKAVRSRLLLVGNRYGRDRLSFMWSPCCVLEGEGTLAGERIRLFLYADGPGGSFTTFRRSAYALVPAAQPLEGYTPRHALSSLINRNGTFYRLRLTGTHVQGDRAQVVLTRDTRPTGELAVELSGEGNVEARLMSAVVEGTTDDTVHFNIGGPESTFPIGGYRLSSGSIRYGTVEQTWRVGLTDGPAFTIKAGETTRVELGHPTLSVRAIREDDRYRGNATQRSTFSAGTAAYLEPRIVGKGGEAYMRFSREDRQSRRREDVEPHLAIVNSDGDEVASTDLEYG